MCHQSCIDFGKKYLNEEDVRGKHVIEVGSLNVNGSLRSTVETFCPAKYIGVDIQPGKGVNQVCKAEHLVRRFGRNRFDVLICTELLEHANNWKRTISNFKNVLKPEGIMIITTRSKGFGYHGFPYDFWRYEISDMERIFSDSIIETIEKDTLSAGVFIKVKKPMGFIENKLGAYRLYSIEFKRRSTIIESTLYFPLFFIIRQIFREWPRRRKQAKASTGKK